MAATYRLTIGESAHDVAVDERDGRFMVTIDSETIEAAFVASGGGPASLVIGAEAFEVAADEEDDGFEVQVGHEVFASAGERLIHGHTVSEKAGAAGNQPTVGTTTTGHLRPLDHFERDRVPGAE